MKRIACALGLLVCFCATAAAQSQPTAVGTNGFDFTVTASDQALPVAPASPGLALPSKIVICNPQQTFGAATTSTSYVNINWYGASSVTTPTEQIAPGVCEVSWFISVPPHVSLNNPASPSVVVGIGQ